MGPLTLFSKGVGPADAGYIDGAHGPIVLKSLADLHLVLYWLDAGFLEPEPHTGLDGQVSTDLYLSLMVTPDIFNGQ
jgi:hypothetical protein